MIPGRYLLYSARYSQSLHLHLRGNYFLTTGSTVVITIIITDIAIISPSSSAKVKTRTDWKILTSSFPLLYICFLQFYIGSASPPLQVWASSIPHSLYLRTSITISLLVGVSRFLLLVIFGSSLHTFLC